MLPMEGSRKSVMPESVGRILPRLLYHSLDRGLRTGRMIASSPTDSSARIRCAPRRSSSPRARKSAEKEVNAAWFRRRWHDGGEGGLHAPDRLPALRARYDRLRS